MQKYHFTISNYHTAEFIGMCHSVTSFICLLFLNVSHVNVKVLQDDSSNYCVCVNAATLALVDAGIAMKDIVCSCTTADLGFASGEGSTPVIDINKLEHGFCNVVTVTYLSKLGKIVQLESTGRLHIARLHDLMQAAIEGCQELHDILEAAIREHVKKLASSIESSG